jgi:hypothetical protein
LIEDNPMPVPNALEIPLPENLPFIDSAFAATKVVDEEWDVEDWPGMIGDDLIEAFDAVDTTVMSKLLGILLPEIKGVVVKDVEALVLCTQNNKAAFVEEFEEENIEGYTDEHLQALFLHQATFPKHIDWRSMARLFNESKSTEQNHIDWFFWEFHRTSVEKLFMQKGFDLPVPADLIAKNELRKDGDETFIYCRMASAWLRDDAFQRQFRVSSTEIVGDYQTTVGYAGSLEEAIAKVSLYTISQGDPLNRGIDALGNFTIVGGRPTGVKIHLDGQLIAQADHKSLSNSLQWSDCISNRITDREFKKALYATEKLLGVSWSKVYHLEDALGL